VAEHAELAGFESEHTLYESQSFAWHEYAVDEVSHPLT